MTDEKLIKALRCWEGTVVKEECKEYMETLNTSIGW